MWRVEIEEGNGFDRYRILSADGRLASGDLLDLLASQPGFVRWYCGTLAESRFRSFFWEHPGLRADGLDEPAELALVDAPGLARLRPEPQAFAPYFAAEPQAAAVAFPNLGGDAMLVAPRPIASADTYTHLAAFVRGAPADQLEALFGLAARLVTESLGPEPLWLSTNGMGVAWLHIRLDRRPKYYQFAPYRIA